MNRFGDNRDPLLNSPAKSNLSRSAAVFSAQDTHNVIVKVSASCQRGIGLHLDPLRLTVLDQFFGITQRMTFNLVHSGNDAGNLFQLLQVVNLEITHSDRKNTACVKKLLKLLPGAGISAWFRPVDQIKIQVIQLQPFKASVK